MMTRLAGSTALLARRFYRGVRGLHHSLTHHDDENNILLPDGYGYTYCDRKTKMWYTSSSITSQHHLFSPQQNWAQQPEKPQPHLASS
jgi:hypothetical protein